MKISASFKNRAEHIHLSALTVSVLLSLLLPTAIAQPPAANVSLGRTIQVPLDYDHPSLGSAPLYFELGARFDPQKPVVLVIADGQQYFIRRGGIVELQRSLFGDAFNVVGLVTRGSTPEFIQAALGGDGKIDWRKAWQIFNSEQWIRDIESVRKSLLGEHGKIMLYGRSGGAYLVHQYLAEYGEHALRAFTQSPVIPRIVADLEIHYDHFWSELGVQNPQLQTALRTWLDRTSDEERNKALITLQRQHFYVSGDQLLHERENLIHCNDLWRSR